jgi:hypothetical protein
VERTSLHYWGWNMICGAFYSTNGCHILCLIFLLQVELWIWIKCITRNGCLFLGLILKMATSKVEWKMLQTFDWKVWAWCVSHTKSIAINIFYLFTFHEASTPKNHTFLVHLNAYIFWVLCLIMVGSCNLMW